MNKYVLLLCWSLVSGSLFLACEEEAGPVVTTPTKPTSFSLGSGQPELRLTLVDSLGYTLAVSASGKTYIPRHQAPVALQIFNIGLSSSSWHETWYSEAEETESGLACKATVETDGATFEVLDLYSVETEQSTLQLKRSVRVVKSLFSFQAFNTYVFLQEKDGSTPRDYAYFIPSLLYKDQSNLSNTAIGADFSHTWILAREERMGLPLAMLMETASGSTVSLVDHNTNPATFKGEFGCGHIVNGALKFGSMGFHFEDNRASLVYCYPGSEGERTYADGVSQVAKRWARRSHPVSTNVEHRYTLRWTFNTCTGFPQAVEKHWKSAFDVYNPEPLEVESETVLAQGIEVLDHYWMEKDNAPGFPFSVHVPGGDVHEISYAMGFVGMQVSCGYYLYRYGLETGNEALVTKGEKVLSFWSQKSLSISGVPRVWWDLAPWNQFRNYNDLRNMQGGLEALIWAWATAEKYRPGTQTSWLTTCTRAGNWLLLKQQADGSWPKAYDNDGQVIDAGKFLTSNMIRFLTYLYTATGIERYKTAALKAGDFCYNELHIPYKYVGSVIDNPYVKDRESGQKLIEAFLCLYDLTGDAKWLEGAKQAAWYTVTYMYAWNIPVENGDNPLEWPVNKSSVGLTIIATGHSGADCGFSYNSFEYLRLYILTGDTYFLRIAELLEKNTKQTMNYDGSLGYAYKGLQTEAIRVVTPRGYGVRLWLPWVTASALDPLYKMKDAFGMVDVKTIAQKPQAELTALNNAYGKNQGIKPNNP